MVSRRPPVTCIGSRGLGCVLALGTELREAAWAPFTPRPWADWVIHAHTGESLSPGEQTTVRNRRAARHGCGWQDGRGAQSVVAHLSASADSFCLSRSLHTPSVTSRVTSLVPEFQPRYRSSSS